MLKRNHVSVPGILVAGIEVFLHVLLLTIWLPLRILSLRRAFFPACRYRRHEQHPLKVLVDCGRVLVINFFSYWMIKQALS